MNTVIKIPKEITKKGNLVLIPESEYEEFLKFSKKMRKEEEDTDRAIEVFYKEKKAKKLIKINSLSEIK